MKHVNRLSKSLLIIAFLVCVVSFSRAASHHWIGNSSFIVKSNVKAPSKANLGKSRYNAPFSKKALAGKTMYWVGGSGEWNDAKHWSFSSKGTSAGRIPTAEDDVMVDVGSFGRLSGFEITISKGATCHDITFDDPQFEAILMNGTLDITGSADFTGAGRILSNLRFSGTSNHTIKSGKVCIFDSKVIYFSGSGTYTLQDNFKCGQTAKFPTVINHEAGTLNTNRKLLQASAFKSNSFPVGTPRALNISNSTIELTDQNAWNITRLNLTTFRAENSLIKITAPDGIFSTVQGDNNVNTTAIEYGDVSFTAKMGTANLISTSTSASFRDVSFASNAKIDQGTSTSSTTQNYYLTEGDTYTFAAGATFNIVNAINTPQSACSSLVTIQSSTSGVQVNLKKDTSPFNIISANLKDVNATGSILNVFNGSSLGNVTNVKFDNASPNLALTSGSTSTTTCINKGITPIVYALNGAATATVTGLPKGVASVFEIGKLTISGTPTAGGLFDYTVTITNGCSTTTATGNITVLNEQLTLTSGAATQAVCINTPIQTITYSVSNSTGATVTGLPAGLKGVFSAGTFTISGTPTSVGTFDYTLTTAAGCTQAQGKITVNEDLIRLNGTSASQSVCINAPLSPITYSIINATNATVTGLPAGVKGVYNAGNFTISGTPTASGTFDYTVTTTGGCTPAIATGKITVNADLITLGSGSATQTVCINTSVSPITYSIINATNATVTGLPAGVKGVYNAGSFTISGTPTSSGKFAYTVSTTGGCSSASLNGTINVTPNASLSVLSGSASQTVCINKAINNITYSLSDATGATVIGLPDGVAGVYDASKATLTISGTPTSSGNFLYTVSTVGGCSAASLTGTINITPNATLALSSGIATQTVCINKAINSITYKISNATGAAVTGLPNGLSGTYDAAKAILTITGSPIASGTFDYTVTATGGCLPATATGRITVNADVLTLATGLANQVVCVNTPINGITYKVSNASGATVTGLPAGVKGVYNAGNFTISGTPTLSGTFPYTVVTTGGCSSVSLTGKIDVTTDASLALSSGTTAQTVCINKAINEITYTVSNAESATVTGLPEGVAGVYDASKGTLVISGTATASGNFPYTVSTIGGCSSASLKGVLNITPNATLTLSSAATTSAQTVCINRAINSIIYTVSNANSATVTGLPGGVSGVFSKGTLTISGTPNTSGTFPYTVNTVGGCSSASLTGTIDVKANARIALNSGAASSSVCNGIAITPIVYSLSNVTTATVKGLPSGLAGVYADGQFSISGTPTTSGTFIYTISASGDCSTANATGTINVLKKSNLLLTSDPTTSNQEVCINTAVTRIAYTVNNATGATVTGLPNGLTTEYSNGQFIISGIAKSIGTFEYVVSTTGACSSAISAGKIVVNPNARLTLSSGEAVQTVCNNTLIAPIVYAVSNATGAKVSGLPVGVNGVYSNGKFTISGTPRASGIFNYSVVTTGGCRSFELTGTLTITKNATISLNPVDSRPKSQDVCINTEIADLVYTVTNATGVTVTGLPDGVQGVYKSGRFIISGVPTSSGTFNFSLVTTGGCSAATVDGTIVVYPASTISLSSGTPNQAVVVFSPISNITYTIENALGATVTGLPLGVSGVYNAGKFTISGTPKLNGTYNFVVKTTGGCTNETLVGSITVSGRTFYWVGDNGNWNDGAHWSYTSGGSPSGEVPTQNDDVFFNGKSFSVADSKVTLTADANCRSMSWNADAGAKEPQFLGDNSLNLNIYGNLELAKGVLYQINGNTNMRGSSLAANAQTIKSNGAEFPTYLNLYTGRFDLLDDITLGALKQISGQFYSNGHNLTAVAKGLVELVAVVDISSNPVSRFDISGSVITTDNYRSYHNRKTNYDASNTTINARFFSVFNNNVEVVYNDVNLSGTNYGYMVTVSPSLVSFKDVTVKLPEFTFNASNLKFNNLNLQGTPLSKFKPGGTFVIDGILMADGTPCEPVKLLSATEGSRYTLKSTMNNFDLKSVYLRDAIAGSGSASQNKFSGVDGGNNINWTYIRALTLTSGDVRTTATINTAIKPIVYTIGGGATDATVTGLPNGLTAVYGQGTLTITGAPLSIGTFTYTVSTTNDCALESLPGTIVVSNAPAAALAYQGVQPLSASIANIAPSVTYVDDVNKSRAAMITPNGDGKNDAWIIADLEKYPNNTVSIYNRSGSLVFKAHDYKNNWDGTYNGTPLNEDVYFYLIQLDENRKQVRGTITIVRETR